MRNAVEKMGFGGLVVLTMLIVGMVLVTGQLIGDNLVDNIPQGKFLAGNRSLYNASMQMGYYQMDKSVTDTTFIRYDASDTKVIFIEKIVVNSAMTTHLKTWNLWSVRAYASTVYTPWNE